MRRDDHPEWWGLCVSAAAWVALLFHHGASAQGLCVTRPQAAAGAFQAALTGRLPVAASSTLLEWALMALAMVPPLAIPLTRHVAARSFPARRERATFGFLGGALLCWMVLGFAALPLLQLVVVSWRGSPALTASAFLLAASWQLTPWKRLSLLGCHRTAPLEARGWRADRDCALYGFGYGRACAASCWAMMLASSLAAHGLRSMLCVQAIALVERGSSRLRPWVSAIALAAWAAIEAAPLLLARQG